MIKPFLHGRQNRGYRRSAAGTLHFGAAVVAVADHGQRMVVSFP